jgi:flavin reductase (DIM6/NTAB) family NADH-FMN oxidoreductase RutF
MLLALTVPAASSSCFPLRAASWPDAFREQNYTETQNDKDGQYAMAPVERDSKKFIDAKLFWRALGQRAIGSTVVTARSTEGPAGFLGLSTTHVSADPPLLLVSIDKRTSALATVLAAGHFAASFLPSNGRATAEIFGGKGALSGPARFAADTWVTLTTGAPVLAAAIGAMDCMLEETVERHGVLIAIGRVVDVMIAEAGVPLVHFRGGYL